jgi:hypothetical protein
MASKRLDRFTAWLQLHQVWFTAGAATFLAGASLWVSYQQMQITNLRQRIAETQALPVFEIRIQQIEDAATGTIKNHELQVDCVDGRAFSFDGHAAYFLDFTANTKTPPIESVRFHVPVQGYYDSSFVSGATKGRLLRATGYNNNERFGKLQQSLQQYDASKYDSVVVDERTYFYLTYDDLLGRRHSEFYRVFVVGGADRLNDADGRKIFADWDTAQARMQLDQITPDVVYARLDAGLSAENRH